MPYTSSFLSSHLSLLNLTDFNYSLPLVLFPAYLQLSLSDAVENRQNTALACENDAPDCVLKNFRVREKKKINLAIFIA